MWKQNKVIMKTLIDQRKKQADILIEYANGGSFTIKIQNKNIDVKGRGVKTTYDNGNIEVSRSLLDKLSTKYKVECNY